MMEEVEFNEKKPLIKKKQQHKPLAYLTGALKHTGHFLFSEKENIKKNITVTKDGDIIYHNPHYKKTEEPTFKERVVYCIHGTADRANAFQRVAEKLIPQLPDNVSCIILTAFKKRLQGTDIKVFSKEFADKVDKFGHNNIDILTHSRGLLVAKYFHVKYAKDRGVTVNDIHGIVGPIKGTKKANCLPCKGSVKQMRPDSKFLKKLIQKSVNTETNQYFYGAEHDYVVPYKNTFTTELAHNFDLYLGEGHLSMLESEKVVKRIGHRIKYGKDAPLSLETACKKIQSYLDRFKPKWHFRSSEKKVQVLNELISCLRDMSSGKKTDLYPQAKTIGDFISAFLQGKRNKTLNESLNFFQFSNATTYTFMEGLADKYQGTLLERKGMQEEEIVFINN